MSSDTATTELRIRLCIPEPRRNEPIIYTLITEHQLQVNIAAATMGANGIGEGWFDLSLAGPSERIEEAIAYLRTNGLEVWTESEPTDW